MADLKELVDLMSEGGPAQTIQAGEKGFEAGRSASIEERKRKLQDELTRSGYITGGQANRLSGEKDLFPEERSLPTSIISDLGKLRPEKPKPIDPLDVDLKKAKIAALNSSAASSKRARDQKDKELALKEKGQKQSLATNASAARFNMFAKQAEVADKQLDVATYGAGLADSIPMLDRMKSQPRKSFEQSALQFANAVLRPETGAQANESEIAETKRRFIAEPGDGPEVLAQKAASRKLVVKLLKQAALGDLQANAQLDLMAPARVTLRERTKKNAPVVEEAGASEESDMLDMAGKSDEELQRLINEE